MAWILLSSRVLWGEALVVVIVPVDHNICPAMVKRATKRFHDWVIPKGSRAKL
jgi:hypothetical protein